MLRQAENILQTVLTLLPLGASNLRSFREPESARLQRRDKIQFARALREYIINQIFDVDALDVIPEILEVFDNALAAYLAEIYQCGNCGEATALALMAFLQEGFSDSIELMTIQDKNSRRTHSLLVLARALGSAVQDPTTWRRVVILDAWAGVATVKYFEHDLPTRSFFSNLMIKEAGDIKCLLRLDNNLSSQEWWELRGYLVKVKELITADALQKIIKTQKIYLVCDVEKETHKIQQKLTTEIEKCMRLSLRVFHWKTPPDYLPTLFKKKENKYHPKQFSSHSLPTPNKCRVD